MSFDVETLKNFFEENSSENGDAQTLLTQFCDYYVRYHTIETKVNVERVAALEPMLNQCRKNGAVDYTELLLMPAKSIDELVSGKDCGLAHN